MGIRAPKRKYKTKIFLSLFDTWLLKRDRDRNREKIKREEERGWGWEEEGEHTNCYSILRHEKEIINDWHLCFSQGSPNSPLLLYISQPLLWLDLILALGTWIDMGCVISKPAPSIHPSRFLHLSLSLPCDLGGSVWYGDRMGHWTYTGLCTSKKWTFHVLSFSNLPVVTVGVGYLDNKDPHLYHCWGWDRTATPLFEMPL